MWRNGKRPIKNKQPSQDTRTKLTQPQLRRIWHPHTHPHCLCKFLVSSHLKKKTHQKLLCIDISVFVCLFGCIQRAIYNIHPNNERRLCIQPSSVGVGAGWQQLGLGHARWRSVLNMQFLYQIYVLLVDVDKKVFFFGTNKFLLMESWQLGLGPQD